MNHLCNVLTHDNAEREHSHVSDLSVKFNLKRLFWYRPTYLNAIIFNALPASHEL